MANYNDTCDIFLTTTPPWDPFSPSSGLGFLASSLSEAGITCSVHELNNFLYFHAAYEDRFLWQFENSYFWNGKEFYNWIFPKIDSLMDDFVDEMLKKNPVVCGISVAFTKELCTMELIKKISARNHDIKIVLGGAGVSCEGSRRFYMEMIPDLIDAYVIGEGERSIIELFQAIKHNFPLESIPGVLLYKNGQYSHFIPRSFVRPLDQLFFPTYKEFIINGPFDTALPVFSRGCINNCVFCNVRALWGPFRMRSPMHIFKEIKFLVEDKKITRYIIYDSAINCHLTNLSTICDLIIDADYRIHWRALAMPRRDMPLALLEKMKRAGCDALEIGIESGSTRIIKMMGKNFNRREAEVFIRNVHSCGIKVVLFLIVGFPGETEQDFEDTCQFVESNKSVIDVISSINTFMALDDTEVRMNPQKYGIIIPQERGELYWYDMGGNDYNARLHRVSVMRQLIQKCNITLIKDNVLSN